MGTMGVGMHTRAEKAESKPSKPATGTLIVQVPKATEKIVDLMAQKIGSTGDLANFNKSQTKGQEDGTCMCGEREEAFLRFPQSPITVSMAGTS